MKKQILIIAALLLLVSFITGFNIISSNGKAGYTGAPGEQTCVQCHTGFDLNAGEGSIELKSDDLEAANWEFIGGETYELQLELSHVDASLFGFGIEALDSDGNDAGVLIVSNEEETQLQNANNRTNIIHTKNGGLASDTKTFSFEWTAPEDITTVEFYYAGNASNNDGMNSGDYIYAGSQKANRSTTGIDHNALNTIRSYPNPATETINLSIPKSLTQYLVYIYNSNGQIIDISAALYFPISTYERGIYYAIISDQNNQPILKSSFIKL